MNNNTEDFPKRKPTRLKDYDYSSAGAYFVTVCIRDRMQILSEIAVVGEGLAPPVSEGLATTEIKIKLKPCGEIVKEQLQLIEARFPSTTVADYIIMPDHIHAIILLLEETGGASPSPTLDDIICAFKSLTSRACKQRYGVEKMFQRSYAEHIIRNKDDYETHQKYIFENPMRWYYKHLDAKE